MKIAVFDVDDTLIIHGESSQSYYAPSTDTYLRDLILQKDLIKYIFILMVHWGMEKMYVVI